jgi:hypothetical protein
MALNPRKLVSPGDLAGPLARELRQAEQTWAHPVGFLPGEDEVRELLEVCFLSSLLEEEGRNVTFTLGVTPSREFASGAETLVFSKPLPFSSEAIRRLAPALVPERTHIAAERTPVGLVIWGLIHVGGASFPTGERHAASYLTIHVRRTADFEVRLMAVTLLRYAKGTGTVLTQFAQQNEQRLLEYLAQLLPTDADVDERRLVAVSLYDIALEMQKRSVGGILLVVGQGARPVGLDLHEHFTPAARHSGLLSRHFATSLHHVRRLATRALPHRGTQAELRGMREAIEFVVALAGIDGALVLDTRLSIIGFGARIRLVRPSESLPPVHRLDARTLSAAEVIGIPSFLGMRHRSAIQFCQMQEEPVIALVISRDGGLSLAAKAQTEDGRVVAAIPLELDGA